MLLCYFVVDVLLGNSRDSCHQGIGGDISRDHGTGGDDRPVTDRDAGIDDRIGTDPDLAADSYGQGVFTAPGITALRRLDRVCRGADDHIGTIMVLSPTVMVLQSTITQLKLQ
ncbi:MAG TPA: hypothetical protein VFB98_00290 [Candidatus Deferrimicrobium sp.]|nr:hypothetical protein [Candidatus Deferrimicrobium sp.]